MTQKERARRHYERNKELYVQRAREWRKANPERYQRSKTKHRLKKAYQLTPEEYETLRRLQDGKCGNPGCSNQAQHLDHCHVTERVRGFLCFGCNISLGHLDEDPARIMGLLDYLEAPPWKARGKEQP